MAKIFLILFSLLAMGLTACAGKGPAVQPPRTILAPGEFASSEQFRVVIYTLSTCPHCRAAKAYLTENHIPFDDREIGTNRGHLGELMKIYDEMGVAEPERGVPLIVVDGRIRMQGLDKDKLRKVLAASR